MPFTTATEVSDRHQGLSAELFRMTQPLLHLFLYRLAGSEAGKYAARKVHEVLAAEPTYKKGEYQEALKQSFLKTDAAFFSENDGDPSGCTAVAALLVAGPAPQGASKEKAPRQIIVANAGDSRSILGIKGEAKAMSFDHKPGNKDENARIVSAGGFVEFGRVNGNLALSRAIGDVEFKRNPSLSPETQIVTADPEIIVHDVTGEEEFLILACDGIWDCLSNQQVVDFTRRAIARGDALGKICEDIFEHCLAPDSEIGGIGCDNMTFCVVALLNGRTKEEWYSWVKERVENKVGWDTPEQVAPVFQSRPGGNAGGPGAQGGMGRMNPQGLLQQLLPGGVASFGGEDTEMSPANDEAVDGAAANRGPNAGGAMRNLRINSGGLAAALGGGRIVLRPGDPDEKGETTYEAHVVDEDDDSQDDDDDDDGQQQGSGNKIVSEEDRPSLTHQPEIVESPSPSSAAGPTPQQQSTSAQGSTGSAGERDFASVAAKGVSNTTSSFGGTKESNDMAAVDVRPSTEGTGAQVQGRQEEAQDKAKEQ